MGLPRQSPTGGVTPQRHPGRMTIYAVGAKDGAGLVEVHACSGRFDAAPVLDPLLATDDAVLAEQIAVALGQLSAYAWAPALALDDRDGGPRTYPTRHLEAIIDPGRGHQLRAGSHSVWYELCCLRIEKALEDLDDAVGEDTHLRSVVRAELRHEAEGIWACLPISAGGRLTPLGYPRTEPLVPQPAPYGELGHLGRDAFTRLEEGVPAAERGRMVGAIRLLYDAQRAPAGTCEWLMFNPAHLSVEDHGGVDGPDHLAVTVSAPTVPAPSGASGAAMWFVRINGPGHSSPGGAPSAGSGILRCDLTAPPTLRQLSVLFGATRSDHDRIAALATTPAGAELVGTGLTATSRG